MTRNARKFAQSIANGLEQLNEYIYTMETDNGCDERLLSLYAIQRLLSRAHLLAFDYRQKHGPI